MKCTIPKNSGFCFGVSLAVKGAYEHANDSTYMLGEVVRIPVIINELQAKGMSLIYELDEIPANVKAKILVPTHGVPEYVIKNISQREFEIIDKTCPRVKRVHKIVEDASKRGLDVIVVGAPKHPQTEGIIGWVKTKAVILQNLEDAKKTIPNISFSPKGVCMVAHTSYNKKNYEEIYEYCDSIIPNVELHNTLCDATVNRQNEVGELAKTADAFVIVGGKTNSSVIKLYNIASQYCDNTQHIEASNELDVSKLSDVSSLFVVGDASTADISIKETINFISGFCSDNQIPFELEKL